MHAHTPKKERAYIILKDLYEKENQLHNRHYIKVITYNQMKVFEENVLYYLRSEIVVAEYLQPWTTAIDVYIHLSIVWTSGLNCVV